MTKNHADGRLLCDADDCNRLAVRAAKWVVRTQSHAWEQQRVYCRRHCPSVNHYYIGPFKNVPCAIVATAE